MVAGRQADLVVLSGEDRTFLEAQVRRHKAPRSLSDRCRMVLLCAEGLQSKEVAERLGVHEHTVGKWRRRFVQDGIEGLTDEYRAGRPRTVSDAQVAQVIERTLNTTPKDATHWSIRSMAAETGLSHTTIRRIWSAFGLQPHRSETFKLSTDPLFVDKVQDIVGLYMSPPNRAVVLCVDEKSQIQALDREQPVLPMAPLPLGLATQLFLPLALLPLSPTKPPTTSPCLLITRKSFTRQAKSLEVVLLSAKGAPPMTQSWQVA